MSKDTAKRQKKKHGEPVALTTPDFLAEQKEQLRQLLPQVFTEGKIDVDKLRAAVGDAADERPERYSLTWAGKRASLQELQQPTWGTLVPVRAESVNFDTTQNIFIEGENLEVLKLLYKSYFGRVKMIFIDPPYNTGHDFVYPDDFANPKDVYLRITGQKDAAGNLLTSNPETGGRYHSAWLSMMYPRLFLARQLLREDGVIFVSIDDKEVHNLRLLMNEIFGEENFLATIIWQHSVQGKGYLGKFSVHHNYLLCYKRSSRFTLEALERTEEHNKNYSNPDNDPKGAWRTGDVRNGLYRPNLIYDIETPSGKKIEPPKNGWRWSKKTLAKKIASGEVIFSDDETRIIRKIYLKDVQGRVPETIWFGKEVGTTREATQELKDLFDQENPFETPKPTRLISRLLELGTEDGSDDIVMDFFAGANSTAEAVFKQNRKDGGSRRFILVQLPLRLEKPKKLGGGVTAVTIADISAERIRRSVNTLSKATDGELALETRDVPEDMGFAVFRLAPSNFKLWTNEPSASPEMLAKAMELFNDPLNQGWKAEDVIYEVAVKEGFSLTSRIEKVAAVKPNKVFNVTDSDKGQSFRICLDDEMKAAAVREMSLKRDDLFICRDVAIDDKLAANLALQCRLKTI